MDMIASGKTFGELLRDELGLPRSAVAAPATWNFPPSERRRSVSAAATNSARHAPRLPLRSVAIIVLMGEEKAAVTGPPFVGGIIEETELSSSIAKQEGETCC